MGDRANLVLVDDSGYQLFYCHWCALTIPTDVFWGPEAALSFITRQQHVGQDHWLDDAWADGGLLMDTSRYILLLFSREDFEVIPQRRLYMALLQEVWVGWDVRWAHGGQLEIGKYVGLPTDWEISSPSPGLISDTYDTADVIASIIFEDSRLAFFPLDLEIEGYLQSGLALIKSARQSTGLAVLPLNEWTDDFPSAGFHIDVPDKRLLFWANFSLHNFEYIIAQWAGWQIEWLKDRYEGQLAETRGMLTLQTFTDELLAQVETALLRDTSPAGPRLIREITEKVGDAKVSASALQSAPQSLSEVDKRRILDAAIAAWRQKQT